MEKREKYPIIANFFVFLIFMSTDSCLNFARQLLARANFFKFDYLYYKLTLKCIVIKFHFKYFNLFKVVS